MITLGITGSFSDLAGTFMPDVPEYLFHDSAAALVVDGTVHGRWYSFVTVDSWPAALAAALLALVVLTGWL
ncbi:hypothetical protein ACWDE9_31250, partial [Streptomyces olivaceoviridis]